MNGFFELELLLLDHGRASLRFGGQRVVGAPELGAPVLAALRAALDPRERGGLLFTALLPPASELLQTSRNALATARAHGQPLLFRFVVSDPELESLPWEMLFDPQEEIFLGLAEELRLCRALGSAASPRPTSRELPRLLVAVANPGGLEGFGLAPLPRPELEAELGEILDTVSGLRWERFEGPVTAGRLRQRLAEGRFHALHLVAHGRVDGANGEVRLLLEDEAGEVALVGEEILAESLGELPELALFCLLACHGGKPGSRPGGGLAGRLVRTRLPAMVAMSTAISLEAARRFSATFYRQLGASGAVDLAVQQARRQLCLELPASDEWALLRLFLQGGDGRLWRPRTIRMLAAGNAEIHWDSLLGRIADGRLLPILGPGLLDVQGEIARRWADEYTHFPLDRRDDLPRVAQFVETQHFPRTPHDELPRRFAETLLAEEDEATRQRFEGLPPLGAISRLSRLRLERDPEEPHGLLARLPIPTYLTTNHDSMLAEALRWQGREPQVECFDGQRRAEVSSPEGGLAAIERYRELAGSVERPLLFHLLGSHEQPESQVLTEDDHLDFVRRLSPAGPRLPTRLWRDLNNSMLLFLGYDVRELDCRVLFRGLVAQLKELGGPGRGRAALLQLDPDGTSSPRLKALRRFEEKCCHAVEITVYWGSVREFLSELAESWRERHGG